MVISPLHQIQIHHVDNHLPPDRTYVVCRYNRTNNRDSDDQDGVQWSVAKFIRGKTAEEVEASGCCSREDQDGNNKVPYCWQEFGPGCLFGQDVDYWFQLPRLAAPEYVKQPLPDDIVDELRKSQEEAFERLTIGLDAHIRAHAAKVDGQLAATQSNFAQMVKNALDDDAKGRAIQDDLKAREEAGEAINLFVTTPKSRRQKEVLQALMEAAEGGKVDRTLLADLAKELEEGWSKSAIHPRVKLEEERGQDRQPFRGFIEGDEKK